MDVPESAGQVELCVIISMPNASTPIPFSFSLLLTTQEASAGMSVVAFFSNADAIFLGLFSMHICCCYCFFFLLQLY